jgi:hypothetical protein
MQFMFTMLLFLGVSFTNVVKYTVFFGDLVLGVSLRGIQGVYGFCKRFNPVWYMWEFESPTGYKPIHLTGGDRENLRQISCFVETN